MKILYSVARWIFIVCLPLFAISAGIGLAINSSWLYTSGFAKYDVKQSMAENGMPVTDSQLKDIAHQFISYFNSGEKCINLTTTQNGQTIALFNQEEIEHFADVKTLFWLDYKFLFATFGFCLIFALASIFRHKGAYWRQLARGALTGGAITLGLMVVIGLGVLINFDWLWYHFHLIAFSNDLWSADGYMLILLPGGFWTYIVTMVAVFTAVIALLIGTFGGVYLKTTKIGNFPQIK